MSSKYHKGSFFTSVSTTFAAIFGCLLPTWMGCWSITRLPLSFNYQYPYNFWLERSTLRVASLAQEHNAMTLPSVHALTIWSTCLSESIRKLMRLPLFRKEFTVSCSKTDKKCQHTSGRRITLQSLTPFLNLKAKLFAGLNIMQIM